MKKIDHSELDGFLYQNNSKLENPRISSESRTILSQTRILQISLGCD